MRRAKHARRVSYELPGLVVFEIGRALSPARVFASLTLLFLAMTRASSSLAALEAQAGGTLAGLTALDGFYVALCRRDVAALILPLACLALCGDLFSRDRENDMRSLFRTRLRHRWHLPAAKVVTTMVLSGLCVLTLLCLALCDGAFRGLTLGNGTVPEWLAGSGAAHAPYSDLVGPLPTRWNYPLALVALAIAWGLLEGAFACAVQAAGELVRCASSWAPAIVAGILLSSLSTIQYVMNSLGVQLGMDQLREGYGWPADRLTLVSYRLEASFFQNRAGELAIAADAATGADVSYHINSQFEWVVLLFLLMAFALVTHAVIERMEHRKAV